MGNLVTRIGFCQQVAGGVDNVLSDGATSGGLDAFADAVVKVVAVALLDQAVGIVETEAGAGCR